MGESIDPVIAFGEHRLVEHVLMRGSRGAVALAFAALSVIGLSACAGVETDDDREFTAWASVIEATAAEASSEIERAVLEDLVITDLEYKALQDEIIKCLDGIGLNGAFESDGSLTYQEKKAGITQEQTTQDQIQGCNADHGLRTLTLRDAMVRNPLNLDESKIMVDCLRRVGIVGADYTPEMYTRGDDAEKIGASELFDGCNADPINFKK